VIYVKSEGLWQLKYDRKEEKTIMNVFDKVERCFLLERQCTGSVVCSPNENSENGEHREEMCSSVLLGNWRPDFGFLVNFLLTRFKVIN